MSITASNNPFSCTPAIYGSINDYIIAKGVLSYADFLVTLSVGYQWKIQSVEYQNTTPFSIAITPETPGLKRIDIIVANTNNTFQLVQGVPFDDVVVTPPIPNNTILITTVNVFGDTATTEETIVGQPFVKKIFSLAVENSTSTGANASIPIPASGASQIVLSNALLTSIACLDLTAIVGNPSAEEPNPNKQIEITNSTGNDIELKHATGSGIQFFTKDGLSIIIPNKESLYVKYNDDGAVEAFRSWSSAVSLKTGRYEHHIQNTLSASTGWWGYRYNAATATKWAPYFETGFWDGTSLNDGFRGWADIVEYDQEVTSVTVRQIRNTVETKVHVVYFEIVGAYCVNAHLIKEIVLPAAASGLIKEIQEFAVTPFTMLKNGLVTAFYFNNNLSDAISNLSIYVNYKEKL